jgi:hypothetical protein
MDRELHAILKLFVVAFSGPESLKYRGAGEDRRPFLLPIFFISFLFLLASIVLLASFFLIKLNLII